MRTSQGFECELDDDDWLSVEINGRMVELILVSDDEVLGWIAIGPDQIRNLIEFLSNTLKQIAR